MRYCPLSLFFCLLLPQLKKAIEASLQEAKRSTQTQRGRGAAQTADNEPVAVEGMSDDEDDEGGDFYEEDPGAEDPGAVVDMG